MVVGETTINDFLNITIKEIYEENPPINYPMITIEEIRNSEYLQFTDNLGEHDSHLGYQIDCHTRNLPTMQAPEGARFMGNVVNNLFMNTYKMVRIGEPVLRPLTTDKTILVYSLRYECVLNLDEDRIYKK